MFPIRIRSDVSLELLDLGHADELFRVVDANRGHLRQWLPWVDSTRSVEDSKAFIQLTQKQVAEKNGFQSAIRFQKKIAGVVGHYAMDRGARTTMIGYWLAKDAQGHGVMTDSVRVYVDDAFDRLNLGRVEIRCAVENARSRAIAERLGFVEEATVRHAEWLYDHFVDHVVYAAVPKPSRASLPRLSG